MRIRHLVTGTLSAFALALTPLGTVAVTPATAAPCGFYETSTDAYYNHCTSDGSHVVIKVRVARAKDREQCVGPGRTWLGKADKIQGAHYVNRTC
ncbi:DUF6355 family natural product biosynthesis protein [Streptomyces fumanus]|uniref:Secreted protein n=1 Tax=Streptomyces fumanus TaxID=67302 RepID=A0A919E2Q1_9ACTN|nr:DUF6355 family natural product biosynthesis protein [Streptomyces fumanus]GHF07431.1 hypothetical protein GCM10018772_35510 [Streptomyces fumanus]